MRYLHEGNVQKAQQWNEGMVPQVKALAHKDESLGSNPQPPCKNLGVTSVIPVLGRMETGGTLWLAGCQFSYGLSETLSQGIRWSVIGQDT